MIELYHHGMSVCAAKVRFALGEKKIAWESRYVDIHKGDQFAPDYVKLNPKAVVPTLPDEGYDCGRIHSHQRVYRRSLP